MIETKTQHMPGPWPDGTAVAIQNPGDEDWAYGILCDNGRSIQSDGSVYAIASSNIVRPQTERLTFRAVYMREDGSERDEPALDDAAPELLEALCHAASCKSFDDFQACLPSMRAAIAKAEGRP